MIWTLIKNRKSANTSSRTSVSSAEHPIIQSRRSSSSLSRRQTYRNNGTLNRHAPRRQSLLVKMRNSVDNGAECMIGNECMTTGCMTSECMTSECMNTECMIGKANSLCGELNFYHNQQGYQNRLSESKKRGRWCLWVLFVSACSGAISWKSRKRGNLIPDRFKTNLLTIVWHSMVIDSTVEIIYFFPSIFKTCKNINQ